MKRKMREKRKEKTKNSRFAASTLHHLVNASEKIERPSFFVSGSACNQALSAEPLALDRLFSYSKMIDFQGRRVYQLTDLIK